LGTSQVAALPSEAAGAAAATTHREANPAAYRAVASINWADTAADVPDPPRIAPGNTTVGAIPRRTSRDRSRSRPRDSRLSTVPTGHLSRSAIS